MKKLTLAILLLAVSFNRVEAEALSLAEALRIAQQHPLTEARKMEVKRLTASGRDIGKREADSIEIELEQLPGRRRGLRDLETKLSIGRKPVDRRRVEAARFSLDAEISGAIVESQQLDWRVSHSVQRGFHRSLTLKHLIEVAQESVEISQQLLEAAQTRFEAGAAPESEVYAARTELQRSVTDLQEAKSEFKLSLLALERLIGDPELSIFDIDGQLSPELQIPSKEQLESSMLVNHIDLRELAVKKRSIVAQSLEIKAETRSSHSLKGGVRHSLDDRDHTLFVAIEIELPNRRAAEGRLDSLELSLKQIKLKEEALINEVQSELEETIASIQALQERTLAFRDLILPASEKSLGLAMEGYLLGKTGQINVIEARKSVIESRLNYFRTLGELYESLDNLEFLCGICLINHDHGLSQGEINE